uniref:Neurogenic locus notch homolog protein 2-like n=1 Tax=Crassostrea virginica TaxID=6565 RepID=A0A8B8BWY1_CRAVI|nr:neurogenic locus notch homolog protein 2-like [Crassostrea virginica]
MQRVIVMLMCVAIVCGKSLEKDGSITSLDAKVRVARLSRTTQRTIDVIDWCEPNPCKNGATCRVHDTCLCSPGWSGLYCDVVILNK